MKKLKCGILCVLEGIDGSGKTLLARNLHKKLKHEFELLMTKEPGRSELGKHLRTVLQEKPLHINAKAEYLLFAADRAQHCKEVLLPALAANTLVISDRLADSSVVYQGYGRGLDIAMIKNINAWALEQLKPDMTLYIRVDAQTARTRLSERKALSRFDRESDLFFKRLIGGFEELYQNRRDVIVLDGTLSAHELTVQAEESILEWIKENQLTA